MSDRKPRKQKNYTVGYGRPPEATRFKPGQSGNPKGRRKGVKSIGTILEEIIRQLVTVTEGQKKRRLSVLEVALRRLANDAMRGDLKAMKFLLYLHERYANSADTKLKLDELLAEDKAILERYLKPATEPESELASVANDREDEDNV